MQLSSLPPQLHTLDLSSCDLGNSDLFSSHLTPALSRLPMLAELDLSSNNASLSEEFYSNISRLEHVSEILLQHNRIGTEGATRLVRSLHPSAPVHRIWLQNNEIETSARDAINQELSAANRSSPVHIQFGS